MVVGGIVGGSYMVNLYLSNPNNYGIDYFGR